MITLGNHRHKRWVDEALARAEQIRESKWTESIAVGSRSFVEALKDKLGLRAERRRFLRPNNTGGY